VGVAPAEGLWILQAGLNILPHLVEGHVCLEQRLLGRLAGVSLKPLHFLLPVLKRLPDLVQEVKHFVVRQTGRQLQGLIEVGLEALLARLVGHVAF
jgi:hypothetical protein